MMPARRLLAGLAVYAGWAGATGPDVTFPCHHMAEICTNMCWAMRCAQPRFPQTLTWERRGMANDALHANVAASGCKVSDNRCLERPGEQGHVGGWFYVCDEYPFYFTRESRLAGGHGVSRCVRRKTNLLQSKRLRAVIASWEKAGLDSHGMQVGLRNPGFKGVNYCLNQPCVNDGLEIQDGMAKTDPAAAGEEPPAFRFFATRSSGVVALLAPVAASGAINFTRVLDEDEEDGQGHGHGHRHGHENENEHEDRRRDVALLDGWVDDVDGERVRYVRDVLLDEVSAEVAAAVGGGAMKTV